LSAEERLAAFVANLQWQDVPPSLANKVHDHVLDTLGVVFAGLSDPASKTVRAVAGDAGGMAESSVIGSMSALPAATAAFVNAFHGRIHTFDDTYEAGPIHPGSVVLSAALAIAERRRAPGAELLAAVLAGYEVAVRVADALGPAHYAAGFHGTGTCNALGAAAAASRALGLDAVGVAGALGHAGASAAGLRQYQESGFMSDSALNGARAAQAGVAAALLSAGGLPGPTDILTGRWGVFRVLSPDAEPVPIDAGLGSDWAFSATALKPFPTCRFTHGPIALLLDLRRNHGINPSAIVDVEIHAFRQSIEVSDRPQVESRFDALMSHQFGAAVALAKGWVGLESLELPTRTDLIVRGLIGKVRISHEPAFDAEYPMSWSHRVGVRLTDGRLLEAESSNPPGSADVPISGMELVAKFCNLAEPVLGDDGAERLRQAIAALDGTEDVTSLGPLLSGAPAV